MDYSSCPLCDKTFPSPAHPRHGITSHAKKEHGTSSLEKIYLACGGAEGVCPCGKKTSFRDLFKGYADFCSISCSNSFLKKGCQYKDFSHEDLGRLYEDGLSINEISKKTGLNPKTVRARLKGKTRPLSESATIRCSEKFKKFCASNRELILSTHAKYISESLTNQHVASLIGCNPKTVPKIFSHMALEVRSYEEHVRIKTEGVRAYAKKSKIGHDWQELYKQHLTGVPIYTLAAQTGISESVIGRRFNDLGLTAKFFYRSEGEKLLSSFLSDLNVTHLTTDRKLLQGTGFGEVDILIPSLGLGIGFNGVYYHSAVFKDKNYHQNKTIACLKKGVTLIHVWEGCDFLKVFARLRSKLGIGQTKINARDCDIVQNHAGCREFFNENHLDGNVPFKASLSLVYKGEIVSALSLRESNGSCEIARYAILADHYVVGGFQRLLKHVKHVAKELGYTTVMTYADIDWTPDYKESVYFKSGFTYLGKTQPKLFYTGKNRLVGRHRFQKHKLKESYPDYNGEPVDTFLANKNIHAVYKTGNHKYVLDL